MVSFLIAATPWCYLVAVILLSARTKAKLTNGYSTEPVFSLAATTTALWAGALVACLGLALGVVRWVRAGRTKDASHRYQALAVAVLSLVATVLWMTWQHDRHRVGWRARVYGEYENYADRFPPSLLVPIGIAAAAAAVTMAIYVWPRKGAQEPDNPYRRSGPGVEAPDLSRRNPAG